MPFVRPYNSRAYNDATAQAAANISAGSTDVADADTGAGTEAQSLAIALAPTETGSGSEGQSLALTESSAEVGATAESETVVQGPGPTTFAIAYVFENILLNPAEQSSFTTIFENITATVPTPHVWYIEPDVANRGGLVTVVGKGFGASVGEYQGQALLGSLFLPIQDWVRVAAGVNALTLDRTIDSENDTVDPEHERVQFQIPDEAVSGDVRVALNTDAP